MEIITSYTGQYLNFDSHHLYIVNKGIVCLLQNRGKHISEHPNAHNQEIISIKSITESNNSTASITSGSTSRDIQLEYNNLLFTLYQMHVGKDSEDLWLVQQKENIQKQFYQASIRRRCKSGMADHVLRERECHWLLRNEVRKIRKEQHRKIRRSNKSVYMTDSNDLFSRTNIEMNIRRLNCTDSNLNHIFYFIQRERQARFKFSTIGSPYRTHVLVWRTMIVTSWKDTVRKRRTGC